MSHLGRVSQSSPRLPAHSQQDSRDLDRFRKLFEKPMLPKNYKTKSSLSHKEPSFLTSSSSSSMSAASNEPSASTVSVRYNSQAPCNLCTIDKTSQLPVLATLKQCRDGYKTLQLLKILPPLLPGSSGEECLKDEDKTATGANAINPPLLKK